MKMHECKGPSTRRLPAPKYSTLSEREVEDADLMERLEAHARDPEPEDVEDEPGPSS